MTDKPTFSIPDGAQETTGRHIVTFRDESESEGMSLLSTKCGVSKMLPNAADYSKSALDIDEIENAGGAMFPMLGVAVVTLEDDALDNAMSVAGSDGAIMDVEPERIYYALSEDDDLNESYLRYLNGYRDGVNAFYDHAVGFADEDVEKIEVAIAFEDDMQSTWGLKATQVLASRYTGKGIKVAVLDTGMDVDPVHPDFRGRSITQKSFISGETVQDNNGHGTHCIGTACGRKDLNGRRYGVAGDAEIFVGKVLSNAGSGRSAGIFAGMEWAINNGCQVISMSLGNRVPTPSTAYEAIGRRALLNGSLIIAAAGNHRMIGNSDGSFPGTVGQPANSSSIMAVAAVNNRLGLASFSCKSGASSGSSVDIAAPGVNIYSSVPDPFPSNIQPSDFGRSWPPRYHAISGTSMATPHVSGIAALYSEAYQACGAQLWQLLVSQASPLNLPTADVGSGLVQAPV
ncbi:S8 family serine peptidase [Gimesia aquarii]|uniref:Subtilisin DY n=1 Tax=Gimesia aquarii TaxID=2527964 RepID=A0A517WYP2_9PLAN|nr:S8 family serine peptidase [Gimesia aquarii]QDU10361.1 Subtilisin DY [Gimesia aquarii]